MLPPKELAFAQLTLRHTLYRVLGGIEGAGCFRVWWKVIMLQLAVCAHGIQSAKHLIANITRNAGLRREGRARAAGCTFSRRKARS